MGNQIHPISFRLGYMKNWGSQWFSNRKYPNILHDDLSIRYFLISKFERERKYVSHFFIKRGYKRCQIFIFVFDPFQRTLKLPLPKKTIFLIKKITGINQPKIKINIYNINQLTRSFISPQVAFLRKKFPVFRFRSIFRRDWRNVINMIHVSIRTRSAFFLSSLIAKQIGRTRRHRVLLNWINNFLEIYLQKGLLQGYKIQIKGRIQGRPRARTIVVTRGSIPLQTICSYIEYSFMPAFSSLGVFGVKVWLSFRVQPKTTLTDLVRLSPPQSMQRNVKPRYKNRKWHKHNKSNNKKVYINQ